MSLAARAPVRAVLLDGMGTLLTLDRPVERLRRELRDRAGLAVSETATRDALAAEIAYYRRHHDEGRDRGSLAGLRRRCAAVLRDALPGGDGVALEDATAALLAALRFRAFRDAVPALRTLRARGIRLVVVSNWDVSLRAALDQAGLGPLLHGAISSAELGVAKPDPALFRHALTLAGVPAADALHVGDTPELDVVGARAAGIEVVLLLRDGGRPPAGVRAIRSLAELATLAP